MITQLFEFMLRDWASSKGLDGAWVEDCDEDDNWFSLGYGENRKMHYLYIKIQDKSDEDDFDSELLISIWHQGKYDNGVHINLSDLSNFKHLTDLLNSFL